VQHGVECRTTRVVPCTPGLWGRFRIPPSVPFDVSDAILTNNATGTSFDLD